MEITDLAYIDDAGYHYADYPTFLDYFETKMRSIYGADIYLEPDAQDEQWLAVLSKAQYDTAARGAAVTNSFSPATAQGAGLARNVKINGLTKKSASYSTVILTIVGVTDTPITNGIAKDSIDQQWILPAEVVIPISGTIDVEATALNIGAVTAEAGTVTTIFTPTLGWQSVTNADAATPGAPIETDADLRERQSLSTANPSLTVLEGTTGAIANIAGVTKVRPYENDTGITDANAIPAHSICMVVAGGDDTEIAQAIQIHKTPGTGTYGDTSVLVYDSHGMPINIAFQKAQTATIHVVVTVEVEPGWSVDYKTLIQAAVADVINTGQIGKTVLLTKLYGPAYLSGTAPGQTYDIASIEIGKNATPPAATNVVLDFDENPVCDPDTDITVVVA